MAALRLMLVTATYGGTGDNMDLFVLAKTPKDAFKKMAKHYETPMKDFDDPKVWNVTAMQTDFRKGDVIAWNPDHCTEMK